jgi:hypothetical protein
LPKMAPGMGAFSRAPSNGRIPKCDASLPRTSEAVGANPKQAEGGQHPARYSDIGSARAFHTRSRSRSPAGRTLLPQWRASRHAGSLMGHLSFTELLGDIVHRSLPLHRLIRDY